jgi:hypothetical protein
MGFVVESCKAVSSCRNSAVEVLDSGVTVLAASMGFQHRHMGFPSLHILQHPDCILLPGMILVDSCCHYCTGPEVMVGDSRRERSLGSIGFAMAARSMTGCTP